MLVSLVAPATATPDWSKGQQSSLELRRQAKMASISEEFSDFDFDRLSASCLRG